MLGQVRSQKCQLHCDVCYLGPVALPRNTTAIVMRAISLLPWRAPPEGPVYYDQQLFRKPHLARSRRKSKGKAPARCDSHSTSDDRAFTGDTVLLHDEVWALAGDPIIMANMSTVPDCVQYGYTPPLAGEAGPSNWLEELMRRKTTSAVSDVDCMERDSNPSVDEADRLPGFGTCTRRKTPASLTEYMFDDDAGKATSDADDDGRMGKGSSIAVHGAETRKLRVKSRSRSREDEWALTEDHQCSSASAKSDEDYDRKKPAERAKAKPKTGLSARFYRGYDRWKELSREARVSTSPITPCQCGSFY